MDNLQQFELFQNLEKPKSNKSPKGENAINVDFRHYKRQIFLAIYSIIVLIIGFVFGAEHAKNKLKNAPARSSIQSELSSDKPSAVKYLKKDNFLAAKQSATQAIQANSLSSIEAKNKYSIQLASFKSLATAQRELEALKNKGYAAYLTSTKGFIKLYSGPFKTKGEADRMLKNLKVRYPDCLIAK